MTTDHEEMQEGEEAPPRGVAIMAVIRWLILLGVALTAVLYHLVRTLVAP